MCRRITDRYFTMLRQAHFGVYDHRTLAFLPYRERHRILAQIFALRCDLRRTYRTLKSYDDQSISNDKRQKGGDLKD